MSSCQLIGRSVGFRTAMTQLGFMIGISINLSYIHHLSVNQSIIMFAVRINIKERMCRCQILESHKIKSSVILTVMKQDI